MTLLGQKETITYRGKVVRRVEPKVPFTAPTHGIGYGLGDGLGIVLNRVIRGVPSYRASRVVRQVTGTVVEETPEHVTLVVDNNKEGRRVKIRVTDIIRRTVLHE